MNIYWKIYIAASQLGRAEVVVRIDQLNYELVSKWYFDEMQRRGTTATTTINLPQSSASNSPSRAIQFQNTIGASQLNSGVCNL